MTQWSYGFANLNCQSFNGEFCDEHDHRYSHICHSDLACLAASDECQTKDVSLACFLLWIFVRQQLQFHVVILTFTSACAVSVVRLQRLVATTRSADPFHDGATPVYLGAIELNTGILCACLPTLRPLYLKIAPRLFSWDENNCRDLNTISATGIRTHDSEKSDTHDSEKTKSKTQL